MIKKIASVLALTLFIFSFGGNAEAKNCKKGKPCGNACISKNDVCHKDATPSTAGVSAPGEMTAPTPATPKPEATGAATASSTDATTAKPMKNCKKGKPCGDSCIPKEAVCTK